jgi:hypothetical protein
MLWFLFIIYLCLIAFDAIGDATWLNKKGISHLSQSLYVLSCLFLVIYYPGTTWKDHAMILILWYSVNRLFLFDLIYNTIHNIFARPIAHISLDFIGESAIWDKCIRWILTKIRMPLSFWFWIRFCIWITYNGAILHNYKL